MKVVVDTNVFVSALLKNRDPEAALLHILTSPDMTWVASLEILEEYRAVLSRPKFGLPQSLLDEWFAILAAEVVVVDPETEVPLPRDPTDAKFLSCALTAGAELLLTGDRDFADARKMLSTLILPVAAYVRIFLRSEGGD